MILKIYYWLKNLFIEDKKKELLKDKKYNKEELISKMKSSYLIIKDKSLYNKNFENKYESVSSFREYLNSFNMDVD